MFNIFYYRIYLPMHKKALTRRIHRAGTVIGLYVAFILLLSGNGLLMPLGLVIAYSFAWPTHWFIEKNQPATFENPFLSFVSDLKMLVTSDQEIESKLLTTGVNHGKRI